MRRLLKATGALLLMAAVFCGLRHIMRDAAVDIEHIRRAQDGYPESWRGKGWYM